jgi:hypothetical protein
LPGAPHLNHKGEPILKIFIGRKTRSDWIVEIDYNGDVTELSIEKSLKVVRHSNRFSWGWLYRDSEGHAQLAAAILYEITKDAEITRTYYQLFLERIIYLESTFEICEYQIRNWLEDIGAKIEPPPSR